MNMYELSLLNGMFIQKMSNYDDDDDDDDDDDYNYDDDYVC